MFEKQVVLTTADGNCDAHAFYPEEDGPFPAVILYMDSIGIREELKDMSRRLASCGYYVLLPNLYYRSAPASEIFIDSSKMEEDGPDRKMMWKMIYTLDNFKVNADTASFVEFLDAEPQVKAGPYGAVGYCMSGRFVLAAAGAQPDKFAAIASLYGAGHVTDKPDSADQWIGDIRAELYFGFAGHDPYVPTETTEKLRGILTEKGKKFRMETYPEAHHGFAFPERGAAYHKPSCERHWERLISLFRRTIG